MATRTFKVTEEVIQHCLVEAEDAEDAIAKVYEDPNFEPEWTEDLADVYAGPGRSDER